MCIERRYIFIKYFRSPITLLHSQAEQQVTDNGKVTLKQIMSDRKVTFNNHPGAILMPFFDSHRRLFVLLGYKNSHSAIYLDKVAAHVFSSDSSINLSASPYQS